MGGKKAPEARIDDFRLLDDCGVGCVGKNEEVRIRQLTCDAL